MKKNFYLFLAFLGILLPYYFIFKYYGANDPSSTLPAIIQLFATDMSAAFNMDLLVTLLVAWTFMTFEGTRIKMKNWWMFLPATLIGLSFALPLFLYFRERHLESNA
jgi:hypothetical protein